MQAQAERDLEQVSKRCDEFARLQPVHPSVDSALELIRKPESNSSYSRLVMWIIKENFLPAVIEYYDDKDPAYLLKTMVASDFRVIDGIPTSMKVVMFNQNDNTQTEMELLEVKYDITLSDDMFTERSLKK